MTQMERQMAAQPQLQPGFETKIDIEHSMDVVPLVQKPEEKFTTSYATDVSVQVAKKYYNHLKKTFHFLIVSIFRSFSTFLSI